MPLARITQIPGTETCYSQPVTLVTQWSRSAVRAAMLLGLMPAWASVACAQKNDWLIVPGQRVGPITAAMTHADLDSLFGKENVRDQDINIGDLQAAATVVYGNDPSAALAVTWDSERASTIHICFSTPAGPCKWRTATGVRMGLLWRELEKVNGKSFEWTGTGADGQSSVTSWRHGLLEEDPGACGHLEVQLTPSAMLENRPLTKHESSLIKQVVVGKAYSSGNTLTYELNPVVSALELQFVGPGCRAK